MGSILRPLSLVWSGCMAVWLGVVSGTMNFSRPQSKDQSSGYLTVLLPMAFGYDSEWEAPVTNPRRIQDKLADAPY